jgi:hypothetical protein
MVTLIPRDGLGIVFQPEWFKEGIVHLCILEDELEVQVDVSSSTLKRIHALLERIQQDPPSSITKLSEDIQPWYTNFTSSLSAEENLEWIAAADYLGLSQLYVIFNHWMYRHEVPLHDHMTRSLPEWWFYLNL